MPDQPPEVRTDWRLMIVMALASYVIYGFVGYSGESREVIARITALEAHRTDDAERLQRLEAKVDTILTVVTAHPPTTEK